MAENFYQIGESDVRPWGNWKVLDAGEGYIVKRIGVNPGGKLSLQYHNHRLERWTIVRGKGIVTLDKETIPVQPSESVFIPKKALHRVENREQEELVFIEVQMGEVLDENDIVRIEDIYNRT